MVSPLERSGHVVESRVKRGDQGRMAVLHGIRQRLAFDHRAELADVRHLRFVELENESAALRVNDDQAFQLQPQECLAHRCLAHAQHARDRGFRDRLTELQRPSDDRIADAVYRKIGKRLGAFDAVGEVHVDVHCPRLGPGTLGSDPKMQSALQGGVQELMVGPTSNLVGDHQGIRATRPAFPGIELQGSRWGCSMVPWVPRSAET